MFLTRSRGSGKITVEFFSALMLFNVWNRAEFQDYDDHDLVDEETGDSAEPGDSMIRWDHLEVSQLQSRAALRHHLKMQLSTARVARVKTYHYNNSVSTKIF